MFLILTIFIGFGNFVEALSELLVELHGVILAETHGWGWPRALSPTATESLKTAKKLKPVATLWKYIQYINLVARILYHYLRFMKIIS